ncbi:hypothetical protein SHIRM173S_07229 [Streptomyces hirsutus]
MIDTQDEVTREDCQIIHDWDLNCHLRWNGTVSDEKGHALFIGEEMNDRMVTSKTEGHSREMHCLEIELPGTPDHGNAIR